jgi:hypothetical protein
MSEQTTYRSKLLVLVGLACLLAAVTVAILLPPARGYEMSVYDALPLPFWALATAGFLFSVFGIVTSAAEPDDSVWRMGSVSVLLMNALLFLLPYIRGYALYGRADTLTHIGYIRTLIETGVVSGSNIYPNTHLVVATLSFATGLEPKAIVSVVPPLFSLVYFGSMYLLVTRLFDSRRRALLSLPFVLLPALGAYHLTLLPYRVSVLLVPFVLYLFVKQQRTGAFAVRAVLAVTVVAFVIYHPLTTVFILAFFGAWMLAKHLPLFTPEHARPTSVVSLLVAGFVSWYYNFVEMIIRFEIVYNSVFGLQEGQAPIQNYSSTVSRTSPELIDLIRIFVFRFGVPVLLLGLGSLFVVTMLVLWIRGRFDPDLFTVLFAVMMYAFAAGAAVFLTTDLIVGIDRPLRIAVLFAALLAGSVLSLGWNYVDSSHVGRGRRTSFYASLAVIILLFVSLSTFSLYTSPLSSEKNSQVTEMELEGTEWTFQHWNDSRPIDDIGINHHRFYDAHYGLFDVPETVSTSDTTPPPRFNYTVRPTLGESYGEDHFLIVTELGRVTYPTKFPDYRRFWRYTPKNFDQLERDRTVSKVYDNGEFDLYAINSTQGVPIEDG